MPFDGQADIDFALDLATVIALRQLRANPWLPPIYKSGVRWVQDICTRPMSKVDGACERFTSPLDTYAARAGDCDDVVPWRVAEMLLAGDRRVRARTIVSPGIGYHVVVKRDGRTVEDPSKRLGMFAEMAKQKRRAARGR